MRKIHFLFIFLLIISLALFSAQKVLVVYSPAQPELNNLVAREFEKKYGIKVQMVTAGTGELIAR